MSTLLGREARHQTLRLLAGSLLSVILVPVAASQPVDTVRSWNVADDAFPVPVPRVAGLSITVTDIGLNNATMDVTFDVQMTTLRRVPFSGEWTTVMTNLDIVSYGAFADFEQFELQSQVSSSSVPDVQRLGNLDENLRFSGAAHRSTIDHHVTADSLYASAFPVPFFGTVTDGTRSSSFQSSLRVSVDGVLPGVDFGDGATIDTTTLPLLSTVSTTMIPTSDGGPAAFRRRIYRRSGLSHSYSDHTPRTIRVASGCCSAKNFPLGSNLSRGQPSTPATVSGQVNWQRTYQSTSTWRRTVRYVDGVFTASNGEFVGYSTTLTFDETQFLFTRQNSDSVTRSSELGIDQLTASVDVGRSVLEVPAMQRVGLVGFAMLLVFVGLLLLRP